MKTVVILLSCLLFIISTNPFLSSAQSTPVLDTDGNPLQAGVDYYAVPPAGSSTDGGGGLGLQSRGNVNCPLDVVQVLNPTSTGLPLYFLPVNPEDQIVPSGTDLNVLFNASSICVMTTLWKLVTKDDNPNQYFVTTGGVEGNPGRDTLSNWFKIQRYEDAYMFYFCPTVCNTCRPVCGNIGVILDNGRRLLGLSNTPLKVTFKKA